ncbi:hypothetical protein Gpo141_00003803 [Globisporangium polare]
MPKHVARVVVSQRAFCAWWLAVIAIHCCCGVFLGYVGGLYLYLLDSEVIFDMAIYSVTINTAYFPTVATMYFALASIHGLLVLFILVRSIQARRLVFRKPRREREVAPSISRRAPQKMPSQDSKNKVDPAAGKAAWKTLSRRLSSWMRSFLTAGRAFFAACDIRHQNYSVIFLARELLLTSLQTYQAYRLSCLVPRRWMNNAMVGALVLNCWATPLLQYRFRKNVGHVRLGGALVNMVLDMVSYIGMPVALFWPYAGQFYTDRKQFDRIYYYSDVWLIEAINEAQMIFVSSLYDAISKCLIALSVARGLYSITKLICVADPVKPTQVVSTRGGGKPDVATVSPVTLRVLSSMTLSLRPATWRARVEKFGHRLLFLWGICLLITHLQASSLPSHVQCRLPIRPWFDAQPGCSLLEFNCAEERATGTASEIDLLLQVFNPDRVEYLMIRHCPLLIFPKRIQTLHELLGLKVFNSTIQEWGEDAAVTSTHHPELRFVFLVDVKMREFPIGLQHADFPKTLRDIEFSRTNVTVIPDTLDTIWPTGMYIAFEECQLQEFPSVVLRVQPSDLALALNNFSSLPPEVFQGFPLRVFSVAGSPLHSLPSTLSEPPQIMWYGLIQTEISELPVWMDDAFLASTFIVASKTPLCDSLIAAGEKSEVDSSALVGIPGLDCSLTFMGNSSLNWYPIDIETTINPSYSLS